MIGQLGEERISERSINSISEKPNLFCKSQHVSTCCDLFHWPVNEGSKNQAKPALGSNELNIQGEFPVKINIFRDFL